MKLSAAKLGACIPTITIFPQWIASFINMKWPGLSHLILVYRLLCQTWMWLLLSTSILGSLSLCVPQLSWQLPRILAECSHQWEFCLLYSLYRLGSCVFCSGLCSSLFLSVFAWQMKPALWHQHIFQHLINSWCRKMYAVQGTRLFSLSLWNECYVRQEIQGDQRKWRKIPMNPEWHAC